ncbi:MAG: protein-glutamate O-methyltransferase CheR [Alphaproteobacteria bacterium]|nr:protein-glutamate O-methyltransferase CheR [Alphaproteobacteria bacterium]
MTKLVYEHTGIVIQPEKSYLFETRLAPVARRFNLASIDDIFITLQSSRNKDLERAVFEAMTTNETYFFRDVKPFDLMKELVLPRLFTARKSTKNISIWCAACASGQEPYSLAMLLKDALKSQPGWSISITATDISTEMVDRAKKGLYTQFEVQRGLPIQLLVKYFTEKGENWQVNREIRDMVTFRQFNLLDQPNSLSPRFGFDVIFCRNVLIYFDTHTRTDILTRLSKVIAKDGALFLGGAETIIGLSNLFETFPEDRGVYRLAHPAAK